MLLLNRKFYKIKNFLVGTLLLFVLLPTLVIFAYIYWVNAQFANKKMESNSKILMSQVSDNLNAEIDKMEAYIQLVSSDTLFVDQLQKIDYNHKDYHLREQFKSISKYLNRVNLNGDNLYNFIYIPTNQDGFYFSRTYDSDAKEKLKQSDWYQKTLDNKGRVFWKGFSNSSQVPVISGSKAIVDLNTYQIVGIMVFEFRADEIELIKGKEIGNQPWGIYDGNNHLLYKTEGMTEWLEQNKDMSKSVLNGSYKNLSSNKNLFFEEKVNRQNWKLIQIMPTVSYSREMMRNGILIIILLFGCIGIYIWYLLLLQKKLTTPLQSLVNLFNEIEAGNAIPDLNKFSCYEMLRLSSGVITLVEKTKISESELKMSQLQQDIYHTDLLRARMNPHFIYNVLNTVKYRALVNGQEDMTRILNALIKLLKGSINREGEYCSILEEVQMIQDYTLIQGEILNHEINLKTDIAPELQGYMIPRMILQPLVENSILYGIDIKDPSNFIEISVHRDNDTLHLVVFDNGAGMPEEKIQDIKAADSRMSNIGIPGVFKRIRLLYGELGHVEITSSNQKWTKIEISIPVQDTDREGL